MLGWMILFAFMVIAGALLVLIGYPAAASLACTLFAVLFLLGLATRAVRGRAW